MRRAVSEIVKYSNYKFKVKVSLFVKLSLLRFVYWIDRHIILHIERSYIAGDTGYLTGFTRVNSA